MSIYKLRLENPVSTVDGDFSQDAEYRKPMIGEKFLDGEGHIFTADENDIETNVIVLTHKRWRAERGGAYYHICYSGSGTPIPSRSIDDGDDSNCDYNDGNYFKTAGKCQKVCDKIQASTLEIFKRIIDGKHV